MKTIGDILKRIKRGVEIADATSYKQVTIRTKYKGVVLRGIKLGADIRTKRQFVVSGGQFIMSRIDARNGAFGIIPEELSGAVVTNDFWAFDVNEDEVDRDFFNTFLQSPQFLEACIKASRGNTNRKRVNEEFFLSYEVDLPSISAQRELMRRFNRAQAGLSLASDELRQQRKLITQLVSAILRDAVEGVLTQPWRAMNTPAESGAELLARGAAGALQSLPPFAPGDEPFVVPASWTWCRFGEVMTAYEAGKSFKCHDRPALEGEWGVLKTSAVTSGVFLPGENKFFSTKQPASVSSRVREGDLIFCRASGSKGLAGMCALVAQCAGRLLLSDKTIRVPLIDGVSPEYIALHNNSGPGRAFYASLRTGKSTSMNNVTRAQLLSRPVPLPPADEQLLIVARVRDLLGACQLLESEVVHAGEQVGGLLDLAHRRLLAASGS